MVVAPRRTACKHAAIGIPIGSVEAQPLFVEFIRLARMIDTTPFARFEIRNGAGHFVNYEASDALDSLISKFPGEQTP